MKSFALVVLFFMGLGALTPLFARDPNHPAPIAAIGSGYLIQPGDTLAIAVWKEKDLEADALVLPDGTISFPLIGTIQAYGRTVSQIRNEIAVRLGKYMPDPVVTVSVKQIQGNVIYVIGDVNKPGAFVANSYIDVMQALSLAGGMTPFAADNSIKILRRVNGAETAIRFRYGQVEDGEHLRQNIVLQAGDVVVVP
ncbi:MAG: polysaccharide biosynthesis/export family protein [Acidiferrobacterales bacterium]